MSRIYITEHEHAQLIRASAVSRRRSDCRGLRRFPRPRVASCKGPVPMIFIAYAIIWSASVAGAVFLATTGHPWMAAALIGVTTLIELKGPVK